MPQDLANAGGDDVVLPAQFFAAISDRRSEPEKRLMVAVLEEAIAALLHGGVASDERRALAREAQRWFASDDRRAPFAFAAICDVLDLDVGRVRQTLAGWVARRQAFRRPRLQAGPGRHQVQRAARRSSRAA
ncbi:MAG: hypothetical protein SF182_20280 [Deltaproteobacteria bacterium]|nr:hypothetical protein [Deltaproteobacteria bacterium]